MSIYPTSKSFDETSKLQNREKDKEDISKKYMTNAYAAAERFFDKELPQTKRETRDWTMECLLPGILESEETIATVSDNEVASFLESESKQVGFMIAELEKINFSRGHELDYPIYPTVEEFGPISLWLCSLEKKYKLYTKKEGFVSKFKKIFLPFIDTLTKKIREKALASRYLQLNKTLLNSNHPDFEFNKVVIQAHIDALENKPFQSFLELRDLLNLGRNPKINRIPSMKEQNAFRFLLIIDEFKKSSG